MLTPIRRVEDRIYSSGYKVEQWLFLCDCGNEKEITKKEFLDGTTKSCGCLAKSRSRIVVGSKYFRLTVIKETDERKDRKKIYLCDCDCGNKNIKIVGTRLYKGQVKSCGCISTENPANLRHGHYVNHKVEFNAYKNMVGRCTKPHLKVFPSYGGRGIKVCDRWLESFENFLEDMGERPSPVHSLDRVDNNGDYEKSNCRWATKVVQNHNKRHLGNKTNSIKGVSYSERDDLWIAFITINTQKIVLGYFKNEGDAAKARQEGELKYLPEVYGETKILNTELQDILQMSDGESIINPVREGMAGQKLNSIRNSQGRGL